MLRMLCATEQEAFNADHPDLSCLPYGSIVLPTPDADGNAVLVFVHPGKKERVDVVVLERPSSCKVVPQAAATEVRDPRPGREGWARLRVSMDRLTRSPGEQPSSVALVRLAVGANPTESLPENVRMMLAALRYTIRIGDRDGWLEHGATAFPDPAFRHGFPDIATRDQGVQGIQGPSLLGRGMQPVIARSAFSANRPHPLDPSERVIYEIHVGTFTTEGTFAAAGAKLAYLQQKGFTTLLLMPIDVGSGFPGWTYDQTRTGAVEAAYGGAAGLVEFVTRAHGLGLEVILDKQYNHRGPEQDSRPEILPGMFNRETIWGPGLSGPDVEHYEQIVRLLGEDMAAWVGSFGVDGFRLDATNRLPWEVHEAIVTFCRRIGDVTGKPMFLLSEYAESEDPKGRRVPGGCQYTDQTGRYLMKMFDLSRAQHITDLPLQNGSILRPMLMAAHRGWWYPDVPSPQRVLSTNERACALLWHHDWIGNRFNGERLSQLLSFSLYKVLAVWQLLGQWTPIVFMGTERFVRTPWFFFTGHTDETTRNHTSAFYEVEMGRPVLKGGRFHEFWREAIAAGLEEPISFSSDGTIGGIDWDAFRSQFDKIGRPYMDHARAETFHASKISWDQDSLAISTERLFESLLHTRRDPRLANSNPRDAQYMAWENNERVFLLRRRCPQQGEIMACFNLGDRPATLRIDPDGIELLGHSGYLVAPSDEEQEEEWKVEGNYYLLLDTNDLRFGGTHETTDKSFSIAGGCSHELEIPGQTACVFSHD